MSKKFLTKIESLNQNLVSIWPNGREDSCCPNDGLHFSLPGYRRPVSIGRVESRFLYNLARTIRARTVFEIGTGFGYSSLWLGAAVKENFGSNGWIGSLDNYCEGEAKRTALKIAKDNADELGLSKINNYFVGTSPQDLNDCVKHPIDLAFIDGNHNEAQPARDYCGLKPHLAERSLLIWHDTQANYDVGDGIAMAIKDGWLPIVFPTSCRICVCYKNYDDWKLVMNAFEAANNLHLI